MIKFYFNCRTYRTGIFPPHTIEIDGRRAHIERGDAAAAVAYYTQHDGMKKRAEASDTAGNLYDVYTSGPDVVTSVYAVAIPVKKQGNGGAEK